MNLRTQAVGRLGERLAEAYLVAQGARLLERNYRIDYGEIDLLFDHAGELVAVEVKTRNVGDLEQPEEAFTWAQLRRIVRAMSTYAMDNDLLERPWRLDAVVVVVEPDGSVLRFDHLPSVYPG
ncbi:MAG: YraN family protein [Chloroflexi bacterium]|nr:YraN family protein [Chloroflexota bacterium]